MYNYLTTPSPVGLLKIISNDRGLTAILWENDTDRIKLPSQTFSPNLPILLETINQLKDYFSGKRSHFDLPLNLQGTEFQKKVWSELLKIPYGETQSYHDIAKKIQQPAASRAVGMATAKNPISIIVPCHRVIGSNGKLVGFAGGLPTKDHLLKHEATYHQK